MSGVRELGLFVLIVLDGVIPLVPGEATLLAQAPAALHGGWPAILGLAMLAATGAFLGDVITYLLGRRIGTTRFAWQRRTRVARFLERTSDTVQVRGPGLIVLARMLPGWRVAITFMAGATRLSGRRFVAASALGATLWSVYLLGIGTTIGALTGGSAIMVAVMSMALMILISQLIRWARRSFGARVRATLREAAVPGLSTSQQVGGWAAP